MFPKSPSITMNMDHTQLKTEIPIFTKFCGNILQTKMSLEKHEKNHQMVFA